MFCSKFDTNMAPIPWTVRSEDLTTWVFCIHANTILHFVDWEAMCELVLISFLARLHNFIVVNM